MGVSSRSAIVLEFDWPFPFRRASYPFGCTTDPDPLERDLIPKTFVSDDVCIYGMKKAR